MVTPAPAPAKAPEPLLSVEQLRVELPVDGVLYPAVDGVSFTLFAGRTLAVVGESGSGKTQLVRAILGLAPDGARVGGKVFCAGRELTALSDGGWRAVRGRQIGMVFQEPAAALDPVWTIGAQVVEAIRLHEPVSRAMARRRAVELLAEVAFPEPARALGEYPHRLSGGLRQRACLAIALASSPKVLLADEPTASLDATVALQILELLERLRRERDLAVLLITHDLGIVAKHSDDVLVLYSGRVVEQAATAALLRAPAHPYTRGLLHCVPALARQGRLRGERYAVIAGSLEDLSARPRAGCAFAPRCPERFAPCETRVPELYAAGEGLSRCFLSLPAARSDG